MFNLSLPNGVPYTLEAPVLPSRPQVIDGQGTVDNLLPAAFDVDVRVHGPAGPETLAVTVGYQCCQADHSLCYMPDGVTVPAVVELPPAPG
jgi:hypothetical protein